MACGGDELTKRILPGLLALLAVWTISVAGVTGGGGSPSGDGELLPKGLNADYPFSGTVAIVIDDGFRYTAEAMFDTVAALNEEFGLAGTEAEMRYTVGINLRDGNGLDGWNGNPAAANRLTESQVTMLDRTGHEIALHGYGTGVIDPFGGVNPYEVRGAFSNSTAYDSSATDMIVDGYKALVDTIGVHVYGHVMNAHVLDGFASFVQGKYFRWVRSGSVVQYDGSSASFPDAISGEPGNLADGRILVFNKTNLDHMGTWWSNAEAMGSTTLSTQSLYLPWYPLNRMWIGHQNPPTNGSGQATENVADHKRMIHWAAESNGFMLITWHDMNVDPPGAGTTQNLGGMDGVGEVLRYAAALCRNTLLKNDGPYLQVLTANDAVSKHANLLAFADGPVNVPGNWRLKAGDNSNPETGDSDLDDDGDDTDNEAPWGYPHSMIPAWADSGWSYIDEAVVAATDGLPGYEDSTGVFLIDSNNAADGGADDNFSSLLQVFPVAPGSRVRISCYASANELPETGSETDSLSAAHINIRTRPYRWARDQTDTTHVWTQQPTSGTTSASLEPELITIAEENLDADLATTGSAVAWSEGRIARRFHSADGWTSTRTGNFQNLTFYHNRGVANFNLDTGIRWKEFVYETIVPWDTHQLKVQFEPLGWTDATSDTLCITGINLQVLTR